jgi:hypothetical protein
MRCFLGFTGLLSLLLFSSCSRLDLSREKNVTSKAPFEISNPDFDSGIEHYNRDDQNIKPGIRFIKKGDDWIEAIYKRRGYGQFSSRLIGFRTSRDDEYYFTKSRGSSLCDDRCIEGKYNGKSFRFKFASYWGIRFVREFQYYNDGKRYLRPYSEEAKRVHKEIFDRYKNILDYLVSKSYFEKIFNPDNYPDKGSQISELEASKDVKEEVPQEIIPRSYTQLKRQTDRTGINYEIHLYKASVDSVNRAKNLLIGGRSGDALKLLSLASRDLFWRGDVTELLRKSVKTYASVTNQIMKSHPDECETHIERFEFLMKFSPDSFHILDKIPSGCGAFSPKRKMAKLNDKQFLNLIKIRIPKTKKEIELRYAPNLDKELDYIVKRNSYFPFREYLLYSFYTFSEIWGKTSLSCHSLSVDQESISRSDYRVNSTCEAENLSSPIEAYKRYSSLVEFFRDEVEIINGQEEIKWSDLESTLKVKTTGKRKGMFSNMNFNGCPELVVFKIEEESRAGIKSNYRLGRIKGCDYRKFAQGVGQIDTSFELKLWGRDSFSFTMLLQGKRKMNITPTFTKIPQEKLSSLTGIRISVDISKTFHLYKEAFKNFSGNNRFRSSIIKKLWQGNFGKNLKK